MKKVLTIIAVTCASLLALAGCGVKENSANHQIATTSGNTQTQTATPVLWAVTDASGMQLMQLTDVATGNLILPLGTGSNVMDPFFITLQTGDQIHFHIQPMSPQVGVAVRLNQIVSPDGSMDGPFSADQEYRANMAGTYGFIVGENMMAAETKYVGGILIQIKINH